MAGSPTSIPPFPSLLSPPPPPKDPPSALTNDCVDHPPYQPLYLLDHWNMDCVRAVVSCGWVMHERWSLHALLPPAEKHPVLLLLPELQVLLQSCVSSSLGLLLAELLPKRLLSKCVAKS